MILLRLVIDGFGKFVGKRDNQIVIKQNGHEIDYFLADDLTQIIITGKGSVGFDAMKLMALHEVDLIVLDWKGDIIYRLSPPELRNVTSRREQYKAYSDARGGHISKEFIAAKMENQRGLLRSLAKSRQKSNSEISEFLLQKRENISFDLKKLKKLEGKPIEKLRGSIMGLEGHTAVEYWRGISEVIDPSFNFEKRSGRGAQDGFNALLNYGYGVLKGEIWRAIHLSSLDPYAGYLHADRWGRPSLVFDIMEEFRQQIVDRSVLLLVNRGQIKPDDFSENEKMCLINDNARKKLIGQILRRLDTRIMYNNKNSKFSSIILGQTRNLAKFLNGDGDYNGFYLR
ncbi:CRISPR-associated endonuclease Cas1 [Sediminibacterium sp.]|uniref:CRISPR-associated endonuclease Cas1 n=1 Tax=Sediminibacterium sp. TaxID=1917865 RepID=UPI0035236C19